MCGSALLSTDAFRQVVASAPLVSIDLVVENVNGEILLGLRTNRPAAEFWFVPGGRVRKNERLDDAFVRLTQTELGVPVERRHAEFIGTYEHLYEDSVFGEGIDTHYVVLAYRFLLDIPLAALPDKQHSEFRWWSTEEMAASPLVHANSRAYLGNVR